MTSTGRRCLMRAWFALILLIFIIPAALSSDPCQKPNPTTTVTENVSKGSMLLKINYTQNQNWTILEAAPNGYFKLNKGNTSFYLIAAKPLDYEELKGRGENMYVKLQCESEKYPPVPYKVYIILKEVNEFAPNFTQRVYNKTISENARIGDSVFLALPVASDKDYDDMLIFEAVTFSQGKNPLDGIASGKFKMTNYKTGLIVVDDHLDYEEQKQYIIKMVVKDSKGNQSSAKLIVNISDVDDLGPVFLPNPCTTESLQCQVPVIYHAHIKAADKGQLSILPNAVKAVDMEVNNYSIGYSFTEEDPTNIEKYFKIDARNAIITKEEDLPKNVTSSVNLFIKAEEQSTLKHSSVAILIIDILDRNSTIIVSTKPSDSLSVGALFTLLGGLLSAIFVFSLFGLAFWIRQKKHAHQPLPGSNHYFTRPNLSTKVFPIRDKRTSESYTGSSTIVTTILRDDSDERTSDRPNSEQSMERNLSANNSVKCRLKQVAAALENRQRPTPKSLRSLALPIRPERTTKRGQFEEEFMRRSGKSEELFLGGKSPTGSNFGTFKSSYSTASRGLRRQMVTNGTLETYVSDYPTLGCESQSYSMSQNSSKRRDSEKSSLIGANDGRSLFGSAPSLRAEHCKRGRENVDSEQSHSVHMHVKCERKDPNMPTEIAPPIPCSTDKAKRPTPAKPPRKFANNERKQLTQSYDQQTRIHKILKHTAVRSARGPESSLFVQGRQTTTLNKPPHIPDLSERTRRSPINSTELSSRSVYGISHSRSSSNRTRLTETQNTERICRSLEKRLHSLEKSRMSNVRRSQTLERFPKTSERARRQTSSPPSLPLKPLPKYSMMNASSSAETQIDTHQICFGDSAQQKRRTPPPLPIRKTNITPVTNTMSTGEMHSSGEDDPQYVNVKYTTLIGDSATHLSSRLAELSYSLSRIQSQGDEENDYLEPVSMQPCLEADLNIRAKLELILASALQKKSESEKMKNEKGAKDEKRNEETTIRNNSVATAILPVAKFVNPNSSSSSSSSERGDLSSTSCLKSRSSENIFLGSADVVWPDPETTLAALHQHHLAMEDYTTVCLAREKQEPTSPCASVTSTSSNSSRCHFGRVNSYGQFIVDIPCAESNIRVAKAVRPMAVPFRDVETSMEISANSPMASGGNIETSSLRSCDDSAKENGFPKTISFDGIDQYEIVHRHTIPWPSSHTHASLEQMSSKAEEAENCASNEQLVPKANIERETKAKQMTNSEVNVLSIESSTDANGRVSSKLADNPSCFSRSRSIHSSDTFDSLSQIADISIRSDCATVMSSELYEPSDSDCETVRSLKLFDSIFDNEDSVTFSSAESDSQSVFRACHPIPPAPPSRISPVCYPMGTDQEEKEMGHEEDDDDGKEADDEADDVMRQTDNGRSGSYYVNGSLPDGVDAVYKEPVLNAYRTVNEDGNALNEMSPHIIKLQQTFVKMNKSKRVGRKTRHRLKFSDVY